MKRFSWLVILLVMLMQGFALGMHAYTNFPPVDPTVVIDATNLPIVWIEVGGDSIVRSTRIPARMKIIHNGDGRLNYGDTVAHPGQHIDYEGDIALRYRGNSSYSNSPKKPYSFRTLEQPYNVSDKKKKVSILGMGKDNNWALIAPYADKSMIRDMLAFEIARPWMEYTPDGRFCELYVDGIYYGVYILSEVVSKGKHRLDLDDPGDEGDALTGGYLMEVSINDEVTYISKYHPVSTNGYSYNDAYIQFQYKSPDYVDMTPAQISYIQQAIDEMEGAFAKSTFRDPVVGYRKYIDVQSFIDYQLVMELGHNVDAYRLSAKFFKRRDSVDSRFKMVIWDMNLAFGNCRHHNGSATNTWIYNNNPVFYQSGDYMIPFWWYKLSIDKAYIAERNARWAQFREGNVRSDRLMATVDSLVNVLTCHGAEWRNSQAWPTWGTWVWPNQYVATDFNDEIAYIKNWLNERISWMDGRMGYTPPDPPDPPVVEPVKGDVNGDRQVTIADVNVVIDIIQGHTYTDEIMARADVNGDGEITVADISELISIILGGQ